ncbi:hypothetical protein FQA47_001978 [Oryzias melastigma]|uniref:Uncharacterized protein n=1 Tax=Oryzias melastigma TaxID=30732 RepID=A0A834FA48_ORYME|nr:hypothetical protein FQA47_001978 [Oryzias melastigma]
MFRVFSSSASTATPGPAVVRPVPCGSGSARLASPLLSLCASHHLSAAARTFDSFGRWTLPTALCPIQALWLEPPQPHSAPRPAGGSPNTSLHLPPRAPPTRKSTDGVKAFPFSPVKPQYPPKIPSEVIPSKYELSEDEAALPKLEPEEYWANYGNEDSSIRCFELECAPSYDSAAFPSSSSSTITPSLLYLLSISVATFVLQLLFS